MLLFTVLLVATAVAGALIERSVPRVSRGLRLAVVMGVIAGGLVISAVSADGGDFALLGFAFAIGFGMSWARSAAASVTRDGSVER